MQKTATSIGAPLPIKFHVVLRASSRPLVRCAWRRLSPCASVRIAAALAQASDFVFSEIAAPLLGLGKITPINPRIYEVLLLNPFASLPLLSRISFLAGSRR
jgi:hypothetical protein